PEDPATLTNMGHVLKTTGETAAAIAHYQRAIAAQPGHGEAWYALSNLKTYRFEAAERSAMDAALAAAAPGSIQRVHLHFALGKALEDAEQFDDAFHHYCSGNALKKAASRYDAQQMSEELAQTRRLCTSAVFAGGKAGCPARDPIFIVGLPRAGSTLLEQILASHSEVDGTLELPNLLTIAAQLRRGKHGYPEALSALDAQALTALGERYLAETRIHRQGAPRFIDKMPNNFRHIGLIRKILPNARVIDARRDPIACCVSGFRQLFAEGQEFTYDLTDLGRYYRDYLALMAHWQDTLPGFVLQVDHEQVIDDLEGQVRRLLAFCDLPFEAACLRYYETRRSVRTPSSEQVRQPIYRDGIEHWRRFEAHLGPLRQALNGERPEP
ncbi:MAG: sulfotransferase, partial [Pseudomonadota bacterium]